MAEYIERKMKEQGAPKSEIDERLKKHWGRQAEVRESKNKNSKEKDGAGVREILELRSLVKKIYDLDYTFLNTRSLSQSIPTIYYPLS